jgi:hypothetical protein
MLFKLLCGLILTEALTELIVKSEIFCPVRKFFFDRRDNKFFNKIHYLLDCGYCTSVWAGWFFAFLFINESLFFSRYVDWFFVGLIFHRLSNLLHNIYDRVYKGFINS